MAFSPPSQGGLATNLSPKDDIGLSPQNLNLAKTTSPTSGWYHTNSSSNKIFPISPIDSIKLCQSRPYYIHDMIRLESNHEPKHQVRQGSINQEYQ